VPEVDLFNAKKNEISKVNDHKRIHLRAEFLNLVRHLFSLSSGSTGNMLNLVMHSKDWLSVAYYSCTPPHLTPPVP